MKKIMLEEGYGDGSQALLCVCGNNNLHQESVKLFWRDEDSDKGTFIKSTQRHTDEHINPSENPSMRRDGLLIKFICEHCEAEPELAIYQHKGVTYTEWHSCRQLIK